MLITRSELRLALTAGLSNGFSSLSGLAFGYYAPLAVVSVATGSYGGALELGRQRLLGTVLGIVLLLVGYWGLKGIPMPLAVAITLAALRLLGGWLKLLVGYKVGGLIVVMGWLVHADNLVNWIPLRFFWTVFGVLLALLSLRLFWPARTLDGVFQLYADLFQDLQRTYRLLAERLDAQNGYAGSADVSANVSADVSVDDYRRLRARLVAVRQLLPQLRQELGGSPERHPSYQLISRLDDTCSRLIVMVGGMTRQAPSADHAALLSSVHQAEAALLLSLASRLELWQQRFSLRRRTLPQAPEDALQLPDRWLTLNAELNNPALNSAPLQRLQRIATRLLLCRQAEQAIRAAEEQWRSLMPR